MNIPAADIVSAGASAARPRDVDPAEVRILAEAEHPGINGLRLQELATDEPNLRASKFTTRRPNVSLASLDEESERRGLHAP